jgi:hypothetical protein
MDQGRPIIRRAIIVSPSSLIRNFEKEARRWLGNERMKVLVLNPGPGAAEQVRVASHICQPTLLAGDTVPLCCGPSYNHLRSLMTATQSQ